MLLAASDPATQDLDLDGLPAHQESILNTLDGDPDTDGDGFDDLVELARASNPTNANSVPDTQSVSVGMTARSDNGIITVVSAVYVNHAEFPNFGFTLGLSYGEQEIPLPTSVVMSSSALDAYPALDTTGWIFVLETPIPHALVQDFGYLGMYALVTNAGTGGIGDSNLTAASVLNLFDMAGQPVSLQQAPLSVQGGIGSIYQPLGRDEDLPASTWDGGLVCWQFTEAVGTAGSSIILDVEDADCKELDSSCSSVDCTAGIGTTVRILDAGALAGGS